MKEIFWKIYIYIYIYFDFCWILWSCFLQLYKMVVLILIHTLYFFVLLLY